MLASTIKSALGSIRGTVNPADLQIVELDGQLNSNTQALTLQPITAKDMSSLNMKQICLAIVKSEEDYVSLALNNAVEFFTLLRGEKGTTVEEDFTSKLLVKLESLQQVHNILLQDLRALIAQRRLIKGIATEFINFAPFLKVYSTYISSYDSVLQYLFERESSNAKFAAFIQRQFASTGYRYNTLLEMPNHRLSQYIVYLAALQEKFEEAGDPDSAQEVKDALKQVQDTLDIVTFQVKDKVQRVAVVQIQEEVLGGSVAIVDPARYMVKQGSLSIQYRGKLMNDIKDKKFLLVLFNDMLMIVATDLLVSVKKILRMRSLTCKSVSDTSFQITDANGQSVVCVAASSLDCATWVQEITAAAEYQSKTLIGVHISDEDFEKMIQKKIPQIPLVDASTVQKAVRANREEEEKEVSRPTFASRPVGSGNRSGNATPEKRNSNESQAPFKAQPKRSNEESESSYRPIGQSPKTRPMAQPPVPIRGGRDLISTPQGVSVPKPKVVHTRNSSSPDVTALVTGGTTAKLVPRQPPPSRTAAAAKGGKPSAVGVPPRVGRAIGNSKANRQLEDEDTSSYSSGPKVSTYSNSNSSYQGYSQASDDTGSSYAQADQGYYGYDNSQYAAADESYAQGDESSYQADSSNYYAAQEESNDYQSYAKPASTYRPPAPKRANRYQEY
jgi:hypothetical protein